MPLSILPPFVLTAVAAYMLGSISFSIIFTRIFAHTDVRNHGSGNAGATNVLRTAGKIPALLTFICDFLKCISSIYLGIWIFGCFGSAVGVTFIRFIAGLFCLLGHVFPLYFGFRGGKGVVTTAALVLMINWQCFLVLVCIFIIMVAVTRIVSLSTIVSAVFLPVVTFAVMRLTDSGYALINTLFALVMAMILIFMHRTNIKRLIAGTELRLGKKA